MRTLGCLVAAALCVCAARAEDKQVTVVRSWRGILDEKKLTEVAPAKGYLTSQAEWEKVWKAWRKDERLPEVDFKKHLVLVDLGGRYPVGHEVRVTDEGDLKVQLLAGVPGKPGYGYGIAVIERKGIKTIKGKAIKQD
jgi:hypothetical protein